jgi:hypothetical protein
MYIVHIVPMQKPMYKYSNSVVISLQTLYFSDPVRKCFLGKVNFVEINKI